MSAPLPDQLDPWRAVQAGSAFAGTVPLERLPRLAQAVLGAEGPASYELAFGRERDGQAVARGRVSMTLRLLCQRCLGELSVPVEATIGLALVRDASGADALGLAAIPGVPDDLDALPLGQDPIHPLDIIEDELLLALPAVPAHPPAACGADLTGAAAPAPEGPREHPFAVLAAWRKDPGQGPEDHE
jgi:uncharacterized protein